MFAQSTTRLADLLWGGVDLAVEFATLGEYRLPEARGAASFGERTGSRARAVTRYREEGRCQAIGPREGLAGGRRAAGHAE